MIDVAADLPADEVIAARVAARAAAMDAEATAQADAAAQVQAIRALLEQRREACVAAFTAIADQIDPDNVGNHSLGVIMNACSVLTDTIMGAMASNGGTAAGLTAAQVSDAATQALQSYRAAAKNRVLDGPSDNSADYTQVVNSLMQFLALCGPVRKG